MLKVVRVLELLVGFFRLLVTVLVVIVLLTTQMERILQMVPIVRPLKRPRPSPI